MICSAKNIKLQPWSLNIKHLRTVPIYSNLNASIGFNFDALFAG